MTVRDVPVDVVLPLWHRILREGVPFEVAQARHAAIDTLPGTRHFAAFDGDTVVGVVTTFPEDTPLAPGRRAEHFRGMAVDDAYRGAGIGRLLMRAVVDAARSRGAEVLWANGRDTALGFYERIGFRVDGDGFVDDEMHLEHHVVLAGVDEVTV